MIENLNGTIETVDFRFSSAVRFYHNNEPDDFPTHWHIPGEIICPIANSYTVCIAGQRLVLQPHDVLIIASGELHSIEAPKDAGERYILNFSADLLEQFHDFSVFLSSLHPFLYLPRASTPEFNDRLFDTFVQLETEYFSENPYRDSEIASIMLHLFGTIGRHQQLQATQQASFLGAKTQKHKELFFELCSYINAHCTEELSVDALAAKAGFSPYYFSRTFKSMTGTTCHNYLVMQRIVFSKSLLVDRSIPITEVAIRSGFNSLATFNRIFKSQVGCTPTEFRRLNEASAPVQSAEK